MSGEIAAIVPREAMPEVAPDACPIPCATPAPAPTDSGRRFDARHWSRARPVARLW